jgi:hypothetical protein
MRKLVLLLAGLAVFLVVWPGSAVGAAPEITRDTFSFADELCGFTGTSTVSFVDVFTLNEDGTILDRARVKQTFTSDSGKELTIDQAGVTGGLADPIVNPDGTVTFVRSFTGLAEKLQIPNGPMLSLDAGTITVTSTFTVDENGDLVDLVSREVSGLHGPHPDLLSDFEVFCDVITPYLMDP